MRDKTFRAVVFVAYLCEALSYAIFPLFSFLFFLVLFSFFLVCAFFRGGFDWEDVDKLAEAERYEESNVQI